MRRIFASIATVFSLAMLYGCSGSSTVSLPGPMADGRVRLPNNWILSPAGSHVEVGELPLNMDITPDERYIVVTNNGTAHQDLSIIDTRSWTVVQTLPVAKSWVGLRLFDDGKRLLVSGGNDNMVRLYNIRDGKASLADSLVIGPAVREGKTWIGGLDIDEAKGKVYVAGKGSDSLYIVDLAAKNVAHRIPLSAKPYTCLVSKKNNLLFISLWGGSAVAFLDRTTETILKTVPTGQHPCDMIESPDGNHLYVANANQNSVSVIDVSSGKTIETIITALFPNAPEGSTPNAVALSPDGKQLYVANADNNYLAVIDVTTPGASRSLGFIPVGWYPTSVRVLRGTNQIVVANGKGLSSRANPLGPNPTMRNKNEDYIGSMFRGTVSKIAIPTLQELAKYTGEVYANSPYTPGRDITPGTDPQNPIPRKVGDPSPIKHVFYIIKENRTYDQVFGDMKEGNGDSTLCLFTEKITPNHHAIARQFVLLDNLYADAEVSADGHNWSMAAFANDYVEKTWPTSYGGRGGVYEFQGGYPMGYPAAGFIWDNCKRHNVTYRSYGEFVENGKTPADTATATVDGLIGHIAPYYRGWDLSYSDVHRAESWMKEFEEYEKNGNLPQLEILALPNDHTEGTRKGALAPRAFVGQNDLALGMIVEKISRSKYWKESAIFVIEDDAQNGPDHVDAHRTVALVISPYTKHGFGDSELYSTSSMVRTMELILGLPALSQFDAAATPMYKSFSATADVAPYTCRPANVNIEERNAPGSYGEARSGEMDFSRPDAIPDVELNEIVWKAVRGASSPMPSPVRSAFVQVHRDTD